MNFEERLQEWQMSQHEANAIYNLLDEIRHKISTGVEVSHSYYETSVNDLLTSRSKIENRYTAEEFIKECAKKERYTEVYKHLYAGFAKHDEIISDLK